MVRTCITFEFIVVHQFFLNNLFTPSGIWAIMSKHMAIVAKLVNAPGCGSGTRGFKSRRSPHDDIQTREFPRVFLYAIEKNNPLSNLSGLFYLWL